ncbi:MAG: hypothetical protein QM697_07590 [Lachnospiraceae bacterium]
MTQKYLYVRREIYEQKLASKLNSTRHLTDMVRLFKCSLWVMLGLMVVSLIWMIVLLISNPATPFIFFPISLIIVISILIQIPKEKYLYKESVRKEELEGLYDSYQLYISCIWNILKKHDIDSPQKVLQLKLECETALAAQKERYDKIGSKIYDTLIGVPLGALIASIIYTGSDVILTAIVWVVFIGIALAGFNKVIQAVYFYTDGYFKDKYLLDILNELNYSQKMYDTKSS